MQSQKPKRRKVYQSLIKTPLYAGVDKSFLLFEATTIGFLFFVIGVHVATLLVAAVWVAVIHPVMVWVGAKDPLLAMLYVRSLSGKDFYCPHARHAQRTPAAKPSIPAKK